MKEFCKGEVIDERNENKKECVCKIAKAMLGLALYSAEIYVIHLTAFKVSQHIFRKK